MQPPTLDRVAIDPSVEPVERDATLGAFGSLADDVAPRTDLVAPCRCHGKDLGSAPEDAPPLGARGQARIGVGRPVSALGTAFAQGSEKPTTQHPASRGHTAVAARQEGAPHTSPPNAAPDACLGRPVPHRHAELILQAVDNIVKEGSSPRAPHPLEPRLGVAVSPDAKADDDGRDGRSGIRLREQLKRREVGASNGPEAL